MSCLLPRINLHWHIVITQSPEFTLDFIQCYAFYGEEYNDTYPLLSCRVFLLSKNSLYSSCSFFCACWPARGWSRSILCLNKASFFISAALSPAKGFWGFFCLFVCFPLSLVLPHLQGISTSDLMAAFVALPADLAFVQ